MLPDFFWGGGLGGCRQGYVIGNAVTDTAAAAALPHCALRVRMNDAAQATRWGNAHVSAFASGPKAQAFN